MGADGMNTAYLEALDELLHASHAIPRRAWLHRVRGLIEATWPDGHRSSLVTVTGTSGKGSTTKLLEAALSTCGKTGSITSPHLFDYAERISVSQMPASHSDIANAWRTRREGFIERYAGTGELPTFWEITLLLALDLFERHEVDWGIVEAGCGGRYDLVAAVDAEVHALTHVGDDHEESLGSASWQRALDKVGNTQAGNILYTTEREPAILSVIEAACRDREVTLRTVGDRDHRDFQALVGLEEDPGFLAPDYQKVNGALALRVASHLVPSIDTAQAVAAMKRVRFLGRLTHAGDDVYFDVAHNAEKIRALVDEISRRFEGRSLHSVVGVSGLRDPVGLLTPIAAISATLIVSEGSYKRQPAREVARALDGAVAARVVTEPDPRRAVEMARSLRQSGDLVLVTGSTSLIDEAFNPDRYLRHVNATYGWRRPRDPFLAHLRDLADGVDGAGTS
jgi:dihydrofolate synthase/folylpolyglutamate synthase